MSKKVSGKKDGNASNNLKRGGESTAPNVGHDMNERIQPEEALREMEERFSIAFNAAPHLMTITAFESGRYLSVNDAVIRATGYEREEMIGRTADEIQIFAEPDGRGKLLDAFQNGVVRDLEIKLQMKNGGIRLLKLSADIITVQGEKCILTTSLDITEKKSAEQLIVERERLAVLNSEISLALIENKSLPEILNSCVESLVRQLDAAFARIWTYDEEEKVLELQASAGIYTHLDGEHSRIPLGKYKIGLIAQERQPHLNNAVIGDSRVNNQEWAKKEGMVSFAGYPLIVGDRLVGVTAMFARHPLPEATLKALSSAANMIALGIERSRTENALRESEARFRNMADHAPVMIWVTEPDGICTYLSQSWYNFTGQTPETGLGFGWLDAAHPNDVERNEKMFLEANEKQEAFRIEYRLRRADGEYRWAIDSAHPRFGLNGEFLGYIGSVIDITERRKIENDLREVNQRFAATYEFAPVGIVESSPDGRYLSSNEQFCKITGYDKKELSELGIREITHTEDFTFDIELHQKLVAGEIPFYQIEKRYLRKNGSIVWCDLFRSAVRDADGKTLYTIGAVTDITIRKLTEEALRESEESYRILAETASDAIIRIDEYSTIEFVNKAAVRIFGFAAHEMVGQSLTMLMTEDMGQKHREGFGRYLKTGRRNLNWESIEVPARRKNGQDFPLEISFGEYHRDGKRFFIGVARDITERREAETERERLLQAEQAARAAAEDASRLKDEFLATVSHELRTPLNAILGWSTMVRKSGFDLKTMHRAFEVVERNSRNQNQIISDILEVSRIITGKLNLNLRLVALITVIRASIDTLYPAIEAKRINLKTNLEPDGTNVLGDPDRLQQVIWNLLSNAVKFTPDGGTVEIDLTYRDNFAEITVTDSGDGIEAKFLPFVFDRFRQADGGSNRRHGGLGLGLSIVRNLVELHGGNVSVESAGFGKGASFMVQLPMNMQNLETVDYNEQADDAPRGLLNDLRILVVDDEADALELVAFILKGEGARVLTTDSVDNALKIFDLDLLDIIISDIGMPERDGYDFIREIKKRTAKSGKKILTVALTAYAGEEDNKRVLKAGYDAYLPKPLEPSELIETISVISKS